MAFLELRYFSEALQKQTAANIILPSHSVPGPYHVMFLLHGLSDDHTIWSRRTSIERYVDGKPLIVVMPDGGRGFYLDAVEGYAYGTAIGEELPQLISAYFPTKEKWCIAGLSMGGYGAFRLALTYPDRFVSAVSHSGAMFFGHDEREKHPVVAEWDRLLGLTPTDGPNDLYALVQKLPADKRPKIRFDCGVDDFLIEHNRAYHQMLTEQKIDHEYEEFAGAHTWDYWDVHVQEAIAFHGRNLGF